jgi:hypothetical protein
LIGGLPDVWETKFEQLRIVGGVTAGRSMKSALFSQVEFN